MSEYEPGAAATMSDSSLVAWIAVGADEAVEPLIRRHERALMAFLTRAAGNPATAEDLFQEIWMRVVRSARRFDPSLPFTPWLYRIAWNVVRSHRESASRRREDDLERVGDVASAEPRAEDVLTAREAEQRTRELIEALPPKLAAAVQLKYYEELTEREVAERLSVPVGTVKSRLHHALRRLGDALGRIR